MSHSLTRSDVELLRSQVKNAAMLDLSLQNMQQIDLSYMDLQGANLQGANLQRSNLRGTNLSEANLQGANLRYADLDGADLSRARLGDNETNRVDLSHAKLSYATLTGLDLRGFDLTGLDLQNANLNESDLRGAILFGANLQGADLSTAQLHGPELRGAILHRVEPFSGRVKQTPPGSTGQKPLAAVPSTLIQEKSTLPHRQEMGQVKQALPDWEAYHFGEQVPLAGSDLMKVRQLFPQGFTFALARQLFDEWLGQTEDSYNESEIQAMWIGFAHRICDLYYQGEAEE